MPLRSWAISPPSKRSRSKRVRRSARKPTYTIAAAIAPSIPPQRAAAMSTLPPLLPPQPHHGGQYRSESLPEDSVVDLDHLGGDHVRGVPGGGLAADLAQRGAARRVVQQGAERGRQGFGVARRHQQPLVVV